MITEVIALGWVLIVIGIILLVLEAMNPGFFLAVPGTTLIIIGAVSLLLPDIYNSEWMIVAVIITAIAAAFISVWIYSRIASSSNKPETISRDSLAGLEGIVTKEVNGTDISGKVRINNTDWSAKSESGIIMEGAKIRVVSSEGVHVIVEEC